MHNGIESYRPTVLDQRYLVLGDLEKCSNCWILQSMQLNQGIGKDMEFDKYLLLIDKHGEKSSLVLTYQYLQRPKAA